MQVDLANYRKKYWLVLVLSGVVSGVVALAVTFLMPDAYEATTTVMTIPRSESIASGAMVNPSQVYFGTQSDLVISRTVLENTVEQLGLAEADSSASLLSRVRDALVRAFMWLRFGPAHDASAKESAISSLERRIETEVLEDSGVVKITVTWSDPTVAKKIADEVSTQYVRASRDLLAGDTDRALEEISAGISEREQALANATRELATFKQSHHIAAEYDPVGSSGLDADVRADLSRLEARVSGAQSDYDYWRNLYQATAAKGLTGGDRADVLGEAVTPVYPTGPDRLLYFAVGFLVGILLGLAAATWMELTNKTVYTADDVSGVLGDEVAVVSVGRGSTKDADA
ncbi:MAG TPA: hypothetical protein VF902_02870 [Coriobacteriia bacterium]